MKSWLRHAGSEQERDSNPRKAYPVDPGLSEAQGEAPKGIIVRPAWEWMLEGGSA